MVTKKEFMNTNYHTGDYYVLPLLNMKLKKSDYFKDGKFNSEKMYVDAERLYDDNEDKFI